MYTKAVHDSLCGYDLKQVLVEDYDFWLRASSFFRFFPLNEDLYLFRKHDESLSATRKDNISEARYALVKKSVPLLNWMTHKEKRNVLVRNESFWTDHHYRHERYRQACYSAISLLRLYPFVVFAWYVGLRFVPVSLVRALIKVIFGPSPQSERKGVQGD
jgi:hypothetical protein